MRLLVINPNTSPGVTARIDAAAQDAAQPGDHFTTLCPAYGPELIVTQADADQANRAVVDTARDYSAPLDGIVLASFGNTGATDVSALRPDIPVIGIAQAAFHAVRSIGGPFGIVTFGKALVPGLQAETEKENLREALLGISYLPSTDFGDPATVQQRYHADLAALCHEMQNRGAASIVMGGGPLAGLASRLSSEISIPLIDGTQAAIEMIRSLHNKS
ncbi:MAG: aspartate/glutamate racemase family protein [Roseobacter sp.]